MVQAKSLLEIVSMKATEFCYWLQGMFEINPTKSLTEVQTDIVKRHLQMVFFHDIDKSYPQEQQGILQQLHGTDSNMRC